MGTVHASVFVAASSPPPALLPSMPSLPCCTLRANLAGPSPACLRARLRLAGPSPCPSPSRVLLSAWFSFRPGAPSAEMQRGDAGPRNTREHRQRLRRSATTLLGSTGNPPKGALNRSPTCPADADGLIIEGALNREDHKPPDPPTPRTSTRRRCQTPQPDPIPLADKRSHQAGGQAVPSPWRTSGPIRLAGDTRAHQPAGADKPDSAHTVGGQRILSRWGPTTAETSGGIGSEPRKTRTTATAPSPLTPNW